MLSYVQVRKMSLVALGMCMNSQMYLHFTMQELLSDLALSLNSFENQ